MFGNVWMLLFVLIIILWYALVTNAAYGNESLRINASTTFIPLKSTTDSALGIMNSSRNASLSATIIPTPPKPTLVNITSLAPTLITAITIPASHYTPTYFFTSPAPTLITDSTKGSDIKLDLIIGSAVSSVAVTIIVVSLVLLLYKRQRKRRRVASSMCAVDDTGFELHSPQPVDPFSHEQDDYHKKGKIITIDGGVIKIDYIILSIGAGCLDKDTEITLIKDDHNLDFKSLLYFGLVDAAPGVVTFLPDGLKFLKPANLTFKFINNVPESELFILHGSSNTKYEKTVWELVTNDIVENIADGVVNVKINDFCLYSYILAKRGRIARILRHLNHSFTCRAYAFYRRLPSTDTIDISVVLISEFVDENEEKDIKQLNDHYEGGYIEGEKGMLKSVHTDRRLEMCSDFPGVENCPFSFKVDQAELDSVGFVIGVFNGMPMKSPASGTVKISEVHESAENKLLWRLSVREKVEKVLSSEPDPIPEVLSSEPDPIPEVVYRTTKLTDGEIIQMSRMVGVDWDSLAGVMDIPYFEREEIRFNFAKYPSFSSRAKHVFEIFNVKECFDRHILEKCFEELGRHDLKTKMLPVKNKNVTEEVETPPSENVSGNTLFSPREMFRLSRRIVLEWDSLAGHMHIAKAERDDIRYNTLYYDNRARAEKILSIFNRNEGFSRENFAGCLEEIQLLDLITPIITGKWRRL